MSGFAGFSLGRNVNVFGFIGNDRGMCNTTGLYTHTLFDGYRKSDCCFCHATSCLSVMLARRDVIMVSSSIVCHLVRMLSRTHATNDSNKI